MIPLTLLLIRYVAGTVALLAGIIVLPMPIPLGIPLILVALALYAGSMKPIKSGMGQLKRLAVRVRRRFRNRNKMRHNNSAPNVTSLPPAE